jgi:hypothetical protein
MRYAAILIAGLAFAGAPTFADDVTGALSLEQIVRAQTANPNIRIVAPAMAMASLPAYRALAVHTAPFAAGYRQTITLDHSDNRLPANRIALISRRGDGADADVAMQKPTESGIRRELMTTFPDMTMIIVDRPRSNAYGVYGLAAGKSDSGGRCVYAWQWRDTQSEQLSLRISLCRHDVSLDALAAQLDELQIGPASVTPPPIVTRRPAKPTPRPVARAASTHVTTMVQPGVLPEAQLDPTLPAAAYRGPTRITQTERTIR